MIKTRIIPTLLYKDFTLVKGVKFDSWRRVGCLLQSVKVYNLREVDELVFLDIGANKEGRSPDFQLIDDFADECFMPLTVGGGVRTCEDVKSLLRAGADKVVINTAAVYNPEIIRESSQRFGSQCIVVSIDAKKMPTGKYEIFVKSGTVPTGITPEDAAREAQRLGAGEILLTSIDRDGTMEGYDIDLVARISNLVSIPVIASGGAGSYKDMADVISKAKASAVAAASIFHFTQMTPLEAKVYLKEHSIKVRL
jgi:imidazole glycerol-phosphate synthase subunit HisF